VPEFATWKPPPPAGGCGPRPSAILRRSPDPVAFAARCSGWGPDFGRSGGRNGDGQRRRPLQVQSPRLLPRCRSRASPPRPSPTAC